MPTGSSGHGSVGSKRLVLLSRGVACDALASSHSCSGAVNEGKLATVDTRNRDESEAGHAYVANESDAIVKKIDSGVNKVDKQVNKVDERVNIVDTSVNNSDS